MDKISVILCEYNNLWQEKNIHKQALRKYHYLVSYFIPIITLTLALLGVSYHDIFKDPEVYKRTFFIIMLINILFPFALMIIYSYMINDLFHIYVIGNQIGALENKINNILGISGFLSWEHIVCPVIYGEDKGTYLKLGIKPIQNIVKLTGFMLSFVSLIIFVGSISLSLWFLYTKLPKYLELSSSSIIIDFNKIVCFLYLLLNLFFIIYLIYVSSKLLRYTKAPSFLAEVIFKLTDRFYK